jgi:hypothetical protein
MVHTGSPDDVRAAIDAYRRAGVDVLYLFPVIPTTRQLELWSEELLPYASDEPTAPGAPAAHGPAAAPGAPAARAATRA